MKYLRFFSQHSNAGGQFLFAACASIALASASFGQSYAKTDKVNTAAPDTRPPSMQKTVAVMVEMNDVPAAIPFAAALKVAQAQADAAHTYAVQHPNLKASQALLKAKPAQIQISAAAASQINTKVAQLDQVQRNLLPSLTGGNIGGKIMYRVQRAYNGIAMVVSPEKISQIAALPGVKAVHPMHPKFLTTAFSDIDFLNTRPAWTSGSFGTHGENIKVADIDTGLDYIHRNFGGSGSAADYSSITDTSPVPNNDFPSQKVPGGTDLAGDSYSAGIQDTPFPDNNPLDCAGHGTGTASLIAGYGLTSTGFTYAGTYDATNPAMSNLKIAPGFAPEAKLYPVRVFGCSGSTNLVTQAIEWAMTTGTGNFANRVDVINMSLGANEGFADDPDDVAASNAAAIGIIVCSAAGNAGDSYYIHSSPAAAGGTLGVAATYNDQNGFTFDSNVTPSSPPAIAGSKYDSLYGSPSPHVAAGGLSGNVVYAIPHDGSSGGVPVGSLSNSAQISGNICLIDRGTIGFANKVQLAQQAGAVACIVVQSAGGSGTPNPIVMSLVGPPTSSIPAVMIGLNDGNSLKAAAAFNPTTGVPANATNVTINNDNGILNTATLPPGTLAQAGAPDTIPSYSSRGPRLPDSAIKPDVSAPAEVTGVAESAAEQPVNSFSGTSVENFNGTSSATPHISGIMALLTQLHPTWSVQERQAALLDTAVHDLYTTEPGPSPSPTPSVQLGVGRIGAGRVDVGKAAATTVVAFNGTDPSLVGVSFGVVEAPVDGTKVLTKNITVENKGATNITYNTSIQNNPAVTGAVYTLGSSNFTINAGTTMTIPVTITATGNLLKHVRESSVASTQGGLPRQWLTEAGGYAVFTPTDSSPVLRVELYADPKPASSMHTTQTGVVPNTANVGSFTLSLSGAAVNTGANLGSGFDILSLSKAFELQYESQFVGQLNPPNDRLLIKLAGVASDYKNRAVGSGATQTAGTTMMFGVEKWGDAATPDFASSDTEIYFDTNPSDISNGIFNPNYAVFLTNVGTGDENVFVPEIVNLGTGAGSLDFFTNGLHSFQADTNIYNNSGIIFPLAVSDIGLLNASGTGNSQFFYQVVTFDRNGNFYDSSNILFYDLANPGMDVDNSAGAPASTTPGGFLEPFYYQDLPTNSIPVNYNGTNFGNNGSIGVWVLHMHNGDTLRSDVVSFLAPTISSFSPTSGHVGDFITITGSNYGAGTQVTFFNNKPATALFVETSNTISVQVPSGATSGPIRVSNAAGSSILGGFTVLP